MRTETACVRECGGIDAFEPDIQLIRAWAAEVGGDQAAVAFRELGSLPMIVGNRTIQKGDIPNFG